jgi:hypothetical protein
MTDHEKRMLIRGMSIANGLLMNAGCTHRKIINAYQKALADAWDIDEGDIAHREEFMKIADEIGDTIAAKFPNGLIRAASKTPKGN